MPSTKLIRVEGDCAESGAAKPSVTHNAAAVDVEVIAMGFPACNATPAGKSAHPRCSPAACCLQAPLRWHWDLPAPLLMLFRGPQEPVSAFAIYGRSRRMAPIGRGFRRPWRTATTASGPSSGE